MAKRSGPSISVKMILTTTLLILLIVVGFGFLNIYNVRKVYDRSTEDKIAQFRRQLTDAGQAVTQTFAQAVNPFLANTDINEIRELVAETTKQDPELRLIYVLDANRGVVGHTDATRYGDGNPPITDESWTAIMEYWAEQAKGGETDPLVRGLELKTDRDGRLLYFAYPVFLSVRPTIGTALKEEADNRLGYVVLGYSLDPIERFVKDAKKQKDEASYDAALRTGAVGFLFVLIGSVLAIFQGLSISKPLKVLAWRADQIARGDLEARVEVTSTDEIGMLGENFNFMTDQLVVLLQQTAEKATLEKELEVARTIQETLVPPNDPVNTDFLRFAGYFQPASQCGGDWWTYHEMVGDKLLIVIGDVTGHGVPSAMITATAKASCDVARTVNKNDVSVTKLLEIMNDAIFQSAKRKFVMTCFASIVDPVKRTITYANAGHNFPYLFRQTNGRGEFGSLMIRGNRLGDLKESKYEAKTTQLAPGDMLIWYTDGIVECENVQGEEYGEKRFRASIRRSSHLEAAEMRDSVVNDAMAFFGDMPRKDDITMVIGKVH
jgi:serine phosphatase RsbU (regulator of sigma subunit)